MTAPLASTDPPLLVSWGELLWDLFPDGPRLGGGAANVAYHLARLGNRAALVSRVGADDLGRAAVERLAAAGVDTRAIDVDAEAPTGTVMVAIEQGEPRYTIGQRVAWDRIRFDERVEGLLQSAQALCFSTLAQRTPVAARALLTALERAPSRCQRICDLNLRPPFIDRATVEKLASLAHAVKLNTSEAASLQTLFGVPDAVAWLFERGAELVALTRGSEGSTLFFAGGRSDREADAFPATGGDAVGAGDAFTATLAHHLVRGSALAVLHEHASRYASYVASQPGAMPPIPVELLLPSR